MAYSVNVSVTLPSDDPRRSYTFLSSVAALVASVEGDIIESSVDWVHDHDDDEPTSDADDVTLTGDLADAITTHIDGLLDSWGQRITDLLKHFE